MILLVGVGGMCGAVSRFLLGKWITHRLASRFPFGTWIINLSGSFVLGILAVFYVDHMMPEWAWFLCGIGFLGAYTTFSTFGYETIQLLQQKDRKKAGVYVITSVILGVIFALLGGVLARVLLSSLFV